MQSDRPPVYRQCLISLALGLTPLFLVFAIAALFGFDTVRINGRAIHGPMAFVYSGVMVLFLAAVMAAFQKLGFAMWRFWSPPEEPDAT